MGLGGERISLKKKSEKLVVILALEKLKQKLYEFQAVLSSEV